MALNKAQLAFMRAVYSPRGTLFCHFPVYTEARGFHFCGSTKGVQIHHIQPKGFLARVFGWGLERIDTPKNLVAICQYHHVGRGYKGSLDHHNEVVFVIHTDMAWAYQQYGKQGRKSFDLVFTGRDKRTENNPPQIYWNPQWDEALTNIAEIACSKYFAEHPDLKYPKRKKK